MLEPASLGSTLAIQPGSRLGPYELVSLLGRGGMGEVYQALDTRLGRSVAIKALPAELAEDDHYRRRLEREAKTIAQLQHPNICALFDVGSDPEAPFFLVMEHLAGETLADRILRGPLELDEALGIAGEIAEAIEAAHRRSVVHRDLKPGNVMLTEHGTKVLDFGLAKELMAPLPELDRQEATRTMPLSVVGTIQGTVPYMAPEQLEGRDVDARSDLWAFGCILYEMVTGSRPFRGDNRASLMAAILSAAPVPASSLRLETSGRLDAVIGRCLISDPERRWQSARDLALELLAILESPEAGGDLFATTAKSGPAVAPRATMSASELEDTDVFIVCTEVDDRPLVTGDAGWISELQKKLEVRVAQLAGEPVKISLALASDTLPPHDPFLPALGSADAMIAVVTPSFVKSESCRQWVEAFWQHAESSGGVFIGSQPRLFKVVKTPTPNAQVPPGLGALFSQLLAFEFYEEEPESGRVRELDERLAPESRQRYHERLYDVAREVQRSLALLRGESLAVAAGGGDGKIVYLAQATSDLNLECDRLRRELAARGHLVLPDRPLPTVASELESAVSDYLERCDLSLHPIGRTYGLIPEGAEESVVEMQNRLAAKRSVDSGLKRFLWLTREAPVEDRHRSFVRSLKRDPAFHAGAEIVQDAVENLKAMVLEHLVPPAPPANDSQHEARRSPLANAVRRIYLICDQKDEEAIEPLEDYLYAQGFEVSLPDFEAEEAEAAEVHRQNLLDCDAALVFYGAARAAWVDLKLRSLLKAKGYGRDEDFAAQAVYVMPPFDRRKERFRSQTADVLRPKESLFEPTILSGFVERVKAVERA